ncbi:MAG: hypothetical protein AAGE52_06345 [Myxococcota bacterium]
MLACSFAAFDESTTSPIAGSSRRSYCEDALPCVDPTDLLRAVPRRFVDINYVVRGGMRELRVYRCPRRPLRRLVVQFRALVDLPKNRD